MANKAKDEVIEIPAGVVGDNVKVLHAYRVEKHGNDAHLYERIELPETYAGEKGVKTFEAPNGDTIYYAEKLVKKFSDNVATDESE